ncbi:MAG TPA: hypothetical protein ENO05_05000, partial [Bacteroides sp.]|nr:hypothetical protein [Bacteroides sp.]
MIPVRTGKRNTDPKTDLQKPGRGRVCLLLLLISIIFLSVQSDLSAQNLYSLKDGNWNDPTVWSLSTTGPTCNCIPNANNDVFVQGHIISFDVNGDTKDLTIESGGQLNWIGDYTLNINNGGTFTIENGGSTDGNSSAGTMIIFKSGPTCALIVDDAIKGLNIGAVHIEGGITLDISGSGIISIIDDFEFHDNFATVTNDLTGTFTIGSDLIFLQAGGAHDNLFINNEILTVQGNLRFAGLNQSVHNIGT